MSPPSAEAIAAARWYGGKGAAIAEVAELDRLELGAGAAVRVLEVTTTDGAAARYLWLDGDVGAALVGLVAEGAERGAFRFEPGPGVAPVAGERPIGNDQSNTSIVVGERLVAKIYRRIERGSHPEIELVAQLTAVGLDAVPAYRGAGYWDGHPLLLVQDYAAGASDGWAWTTAALAAGDDAVGGEVGETAAAARGRARRARGDDGERLPVRRLGRRRRTAARARRSRSRDPSSRALLEARRGEIRERLELLRRPIRARR